MSVVMDNKKPILIVGLGNPGPQYTLTRHNAGFIAVDTLTGPDVQWKKEKNALVVRGELDLSDGTTGKVIFAKPQTYMNLSGVAVAGLMTRYKIPLQNIIVIHDDMDIRIGDVKMKTGGGSAGHNGIKSIDSHIGNEYVRIRIGIGHPRDTGAMTDPADWVLGRFTKTELEKIMDVASRISVEC